MNKMTRPQDLMLPKVTTVGCNNGTAMTSSGSARSVKAVNPRIILASISGFGETGPYRTRAGFDQIAQGMGGLMSVTGLPGQGPVRAGIANADPKAMFVGKSGKRITPRSEAPHSAQKRCRSATSTPHEGHTIVLTVRDQRREWLA